jgi:phage terminase large subunit-like protein
MVKKVEALKYQQGTLYKPYPKQAIFHAAGLRHKERLLMAGNQEGKTHSGAYELSLHLTGRYPDWWQGRRFDKGVHAWAVGVTNETTRDLVQNKLLGDIGDWGTGMVPRDSLFGEPTTGRGISGAIDFFRVKHVSGDVSLCKFKAYEQGWQKFQGNPMNVIWCDEEADTKIYEECLARLIATDGMIYTTFTPLLGMTEVVRRFYPHCTDGEKHLTHMQIEDAHHIPAERREAIINGFAPHERDARARGIPILGSGRVYPIEESTIAEGPFAIPSYMARIVGLDLGGGGHATAAVWCAYDRDQDIIHLTDIYKQTAPQIAIHAAAITQRGKWMPVAWPHDAWQKDRNSGEHYKTIYQQHGCTMLSTHAAFSDGTNAVEPGIDDLFQRMSEGRFKVAAHLDPWWAEFRMYHRKDGKIVKEHDDLMDATRYALMMMRYARTAVPLVRQPQHTPDYDPVAPPNTKPDDPNQRQIPGTDRFYN